MGNRQTDALHYTAFPSVPGVSAARLKAVAGGLAFAADNEKRTCYPSYRDLADRGGITKRGAIEAVSWLEALGFMEVQARQVKGSKESTSNLYTLREVVDIPEAEVHYRKGVKAFRGWAARVPGETLLFSHPKWCRDCTTLVQGLHYGSEGSSLQWCSDDTTMVMAVHHGGEEPSPKSLTELLKLTLKGMLEENDSTATTSPSPVQSPSTGQGDCQAKTGDGSQEEPKNPVPPAVPPADGSEPACPPVPAGPSPQPRPSPPLIAKFESRCTKCKSKISLGDLIAGASRGYRHARCPAPPPNPDDRAVGGVTYRKEALDDIEDPDGRVTFRWWSRVDPDGSLHGLTTEEARTLGLPAA